MQPLRYSRLRVLVQRTGEQEPPSPQVMLLMIMMLMIMMIMMIMLNMMIMMLMMLMMLMTPYDKSSAGASITSGHD